mgnify:CR=1 FL=1
MLIAALAATAFAPTHAAEHEVFAFCTSCSVALLGKRLDIITTIAAFGTPDADLVTLAHAQQPPVRVVMGTDFDKTMLGNATARTAWVGDRVAQVKSLGIDGLNLDIEGNAAHRDEIPRRTAPSVYASAHAQLFAPPLDVGGAVDRDGEGVRPAAQRHRIRERARARRRAAEAHRGEACRPAGPKSQPWILPTVGWNPPGTPLILFPGPGYIDISEGELTIFHLTPISLDLKPKSC